MKRGPLWSSLGIRLADALEAALRLPGEHDSLSVRVTARGYRGGFRVVRLPLPGELPPLDAPEDTWDVDAELQSVAGSEFWFSGPLLDRRRLVRALRIYVEDPARADVLLGRARVPRTSRRIPYE